MKPRIHVTAAMIALFTILTFWFSTVLVELFGTHELIVWVKTAIPWGLIVLIPALMITGGSGMAMGKRRTDALILAKKRRMPIIAALGILVLVPSAFFLAWKANQGELDAMFYAIQGIELLAGATNIVLMGLNVRDGLIAASHRRAGSAL
ncbi:hypothetical protein ACPF7Z_14415 [Halomonas sp. GXIMD04776]|uniref:hypothetical protein n=1 Tax=Halomonas sp. GXIMD04776 TaxID=3415605 RepID=UPI003C9AD295